MPYYHLLVILHTRGSAVVVTPKKDAVVVAPRKSAGQDRISDIAAMKKPVKQIRPVEIKEERVCYIPHQSLVRSPRAALLLLSMATHSQ